MVNKSTFDTLIDVIKELNATDRAKEATFNACGETFVLQKSGIAYDLHARGYGYLGSVDIKIENNDMVEHVAFFFDKVIKHYIRNSKKRAEEELREAMMKLCSHLDMYLTSPEYSSMYDEGRSLHPTYDELYNLCCNMKSSLESLLKGD